MSSALSDNGTRQEEADETEAEDGEVGADDVRRVFGAAEARLDEREAGLHEDDQDGTDDHPQHVDLSTECNHRFVRAASGLRPVENDSIHSSVSAFGWPVCHARRQLTDVAFRRNIPIVSC
jgi:hypothetical protein